MKYGVELADEQARYIAAQRDEYSSATVVGVALTRLADAIRANPPKPPRMDEPGWGEKVWAHTRGDADEAWLHDYPGQQGDGPYVWANVEGRRARWDDLIDPEPWRADA